MQPWVLKNLHRRQSLFEMLASTLHYTRGGGSIYKLGIRKSEVSKTKKGITDRLIRVYQVHGNIEKQPRKTRATRLLSVDLEHGSKATNKSWIENCLPTSAAVYNDNHTDSYTFF